MQKNIIGNTNIILKSMRLNCKIMHFISTLKSFLRRIIVRKTYSDYCITSEID